MAYLGAIDLIVNKTVSILTVKRLPSSSLNTPDVNSTVTQVQALSITFNNRVVKYDNLTGGLTSVRTVPSVQTYYNTTLKNVSVSTVIDTVVSGTSGITIGRYSIITVGGPLVTWNTNPGDLGTFLTNSVVSFNVSASTNTGGTLSYTVTVGTLPSNLSLSPSTGVISGVINNTVTVNTTYSFTITATESIAGAYANQGFTITESVRDPYFNYVTLLLNGESPSNNSRNLNTFFLDSSSASLPFYPTPVNRGNVTQGSFGPFNTVNTNGWSGFFNRSASDGLIISGNNVFNFLGASDFTCEAWIFMNSLPVAGDSWTANYNNQFVVMECGSPSTADGFSCLIGNTKIFVQSNEVQYGTVNHGMVINTWYHVAWVRYNNTMYFYINGTQVGSVAFTVNVGTGTNTYIGSETGQGAYFDGYISNIRVIKNQALYTGAFTPATATLTSTTVGTSGANVAASITGTVSLLMLQNNRFLDNSINNFTISVTTGAPKSFPFSAFAPSKYFTLDNNSGVSAYFSGTAGDYLVLPNYGTGSSLSYDAIINWYQPRYYSIECWINPTGYAVTAQSPLLIGNMDPVAGTNYWSFGLFSGGVLRFKYYNGVEVTLSTTTSVPIGTWSHIAFVKVGLNILLYINGVISASAIISGTPQWNAATQLTIGQNNGSAWGGYLYNLRVNSSFLSTTNPFNSAIYPAVAALPSATLGSAPALAGSGVQLLTAQSSTFVDNSPNSYSMNNGIAPFSGTYSYLFNGSNQFINYSNPATLAFGTNAAFTIEFWLYVTNWSTNPIILDWRPSATQGVYITIYSNTSGQIRFYTSSADRITSGIVIPTHTWAHVALVRSAAVTKLYINGIADSITYADTNSYLVGTNRPIVGNGNAATYFPGALSNLRITTVAVYTGNFTPPTSALPLTQSAGAAGTNIAAITSGQTVLLTAQATTITDATGLSITNSANPVVESGSLVLANGSIPFANTYSAVLTGTKLASVNYSTNYNLIDDFTIEFWVNYSSHTSGAGLISFGNAWQITWSAATNALKFEGNNAAVTLTTTTTLVTGLWYHVALTRSGTYMRFFINGTQDTTTTTSTVAFTAVGTGSTPSIVIGADKTLSLFTTGYMSNVRFMNRKAYYLQNFAIPTTPFTNPTNLNGVQVLTAQSSTVTDNSATNIVIQSTGFTVTNSAMPFANTYSTMFNGVNSNVFLPGTALGINALDLTGDFTIEMWFNSNVIGQNVPDGTTATTGHLLNRGGGTNIAYASYELYVSNGGLYFAASSTNASYDIGGENSIGLIGLINSGVWYHVAITKSGNQYRGFLNGIQTWYQYLALTPYTIGSARGLAIGSNYVTTWGTPANITNSFSGYISNLRVVKGTALYTSNFTPSTTPLTAVSGTSLLTLQSATLIDNSSYIQPLTASGYSFSSNIIPFSSGTISTGFSNNTNFTGNLPVAINTSNFSLDFWSNPQSFNNSTNPGIFDTRASASDTLGFGVYLSTTNVVLRIGGTANNIFTTSGAILPFANTYSWSFTGSTQFITAPSTTEFAFGSGVNFTVEAWVYPFAYGGTSVGASIVGTTNGAGSGWSLNLGQDINTFRLISNASGGWADNIIAGTGNGPSLNTWTHVALVRNGATISLYKNGVSVGTPITTGSTYNFTSPSNLVNIGYFSDGTSVRYFNGYMSNVRIVKGAALYISTFIPPTTALTNTVSTILYMTSSTYYGVFNGSNQYLTVGAAAAFSFGTGDFTVETWLWTASYTNTYGRAIVDTRPLATNGAYWYLGLESNGVPVFTTLVIGGVTITGSSSCATSSWVHLAATRQNGTIRLFVNGVSAATPITGNTDNISSSASGFRIGINAHASVGGFAAETLWNGYISNLRIVKGGALYTSNFTPSGPLTTSVGSGSVSMLALQSASATTDTSGSSTISNPTSITPVISYYGGSSLLTLQSATLIDNSSNVFTLTNSASPVTLNVAANFYGTFTWNHIALVKNSGQIYCYLNGVLKSTVTDTSTFSNTKFFVGSTFDPYYFLGYINNLRLVTGVPLIGNNLLPNSIPFLPVTSQLSAITNTTLLTANLGVIGDVSGNSGTTIPQPTYITGTAYGTFFPTTSKTYLSLPSSASLWNLTADFCIECWVYPTAVYNDGGAGNGSWGIVDARVSGQTPAVWNFALGVTGFSTAWKVNFYTGSSYVGTTTVPLNTWTHVAVVRYGSSLRIYVNGAVDYNNASFGTGAISPGTTAPRIGTKDNTLTGYDTQGYISNLRIVNGAPVYTGNFTPVGPLNKTQSSGTNIQALSGTETVLLTLQNNSYVDNSNNNLTVTPTNTTTVTFPFNIPSTLTNSASAVTTSNSIIPFANTYSYYFNGTTQYLTGTTGTQFQFPGDFTIECWVYSSTGTGQASYSGIFDTRTTNVGSSTAIALNFSPAGYLNFYINSVNYTSTVLLGSNVWAHVALVRSGTIITLFQNGIPVAVATGMTFNLSNGYCWIGALAGAPATSFWNGYISNLRVVKGSAVYTVPTPSFTPATSNTSVSNSTVQLLTAQSAAIVDNSINTFALTNANTVLSGNTVIPFSGTYSYQFNGTNYLTATSTTSFNMLTYDFTIEAWINLSSYNFDLPAILMTAQSPIIYDNSPYRSTITNNNNVGLSTLYPSTFTTPTYSYSFNGTNQSLYVAANPAFAFGYSDFTVEAWVYFNALATFTNVVQNDAVGSSGTDKWYFAYNASTLTFCNHGALSVRITIPWTPSLSTWYHVAVVRYNGNFLAFINGTQGVSTITGTPSTYSFGQNGFSIGAISTPYYTNGFISNLRIINGRALYTGSFTPSTVPLTALATGTGSAIVGTTNGAQTGYSLWISPDASTIYFSSNATGYWVHNISATAGQLILNTWYHIAVTRQGSTINIWRNGISIASAATFAFNTFRSPNNALYIGYFNDGAITRNFNGYISNLRITQGLALYSATFGPQLSQFTINSNSNIPSYIANSFYNPPTSGTNNTLLLLAQTSSYLDNSSYAVPLLMSNATAPITNSVIPYSNTYSFDFLGTNANSYLSVPPNSNFDLYYQGSTIEFWMYPRFFDAFDGTIISSGSWARGYVWRLTGNVSGALSFIGNNTVTFTTANNAINFNAWNHIAITRFLYTYSIWINGVNKASGWSTANPSTVGKYLYIGCGRPGNYQSVLISNVRVVSGNSTNLYTKAFSPPTSNLTAIPNTIFLIGNTQGFGISASEGYAPSIAANGYACAIPVSNITPFANTYSWSFNSNSSITWAPGFAFGTNPFTIELWFYNTSNAWTNVGLVGCNAANTASLFVHLVSQTQITLGRYGVGNLYFNFPTMLQNTWYHLAVVRDGNNFNTMFLNGVRTISGALLDSYNYTGITNTLGGLNTINAFAGLISNVRIVYGQDSALYDVAAAYVTIPTVPLTAVPNTQLLTLQDYSPIDNSNNNYFITNQASGPMISKFTPFANTYSVHFSASGNYNYLYAGQNSLTQFEARDFTIETWCYFYNATANAHQVIFSNYTSWTTDSIWWGKHSSYSGYVCLFINNSYGTIGSIPILQETTYPTNKTWIHYAVVRIGSTFTMYRNGVATVTSVGQWNGIASGTMNPVYIGISGDSVVNTSTSFYGYLSNYRIVNGLGIYTGNFTPPTTPLQRTQSAGTNIAAISAGQTVLLTCQSDNFIDNSLSNLFMDTSPSQFLSTTSVVPFSGAYSISTYSFNNAWLISTQYNGTQLSLSGFPLTVECWFYIIASSGVSQTLISTSNWFMQIGSAVNTFIWYISLNTLTIPYNFNFGTWYHAAWTYDTITHRIYINGLLIGAYNSSAAWTEGTQVWIGSGAGNNYFYGYISNMRIVKGSVVYGIPSFTPATTALTNSVNSTMLLTAQTATFVDNSIMNWYIANAGAGLVTSTNSITPFSSTYSYVFNGVNNMLAITTASSNSLELQDDFTIELWFNSNVIYGSSLATSATLINKNGGQNIAWPSWAITLWGNTIYFGASSNNDGYDIGGEPGGYLRSSVPAGNSGTINGVGLLGTFSINTWYHVAVVRYNGVYKGYLNGNNTWTQGGMNPYTNNIRGVTIGGTYGGPLNYNNYVQASSIIYSPNWGGNHSSTSANTYGFFNGYISNVRINNGAAIYTTNFTPASAALTTSTTNNYTALLTAQSSTPIDNSPITKYILGGPTYTTNSLIPFANTYSYSLLSTVDYRAISGYMTIASQGPFSLTANTTAFTIEMWVYPIIMPTGSTLFTEGWTGSNYISMTIGFASYGVSTDLGSGTSTGSYIAMGFYTGSGWVMTPANTMLELFKWTHIAAVYDGISTASLFLNGVLNGTVNTTWHTAFNDTVTYIGRRWDLYSDYNNGFQGFISNFRYVKGQALYTYNFTPPTSAVTATPTTLMLMNFDNASIYDATAKNALTTYGNPTISTGVVKYGTGSIRFSRTDPASYLIIPATNYLYFSSDFTIECWVYLTSMPISNTYPDAYWIFATGAAATAAGTDLFIGSTLLNFNLTTTASPEISIAHGIVANTWYHIAICRNGTNLRAYVGGFLKQTATASTAASISGYNVVIGRSDIAGSANTSGGFNGYIDDLRITKYARYTSTTSPAFTPPTGPLPIG